MRLFLIILFLLHILYPRSQYHGCTENNNNRNSCYSRSDYLPVTHLSGSGHFMIHYDNNSASDDAPDLTDTLSFYHTGTEGIDYSIVIEGNNIPDYIEQVGIIADSTRYILTDIMGFHKEIDDEDGKYDIYVLDLAGTSCAAYGWNRNDPQGSPTNSSYMQIDNNFVEEDEIFYSYGIKAMRVTVAHEFFHAIQKFYDYESGDDAYFYEFTSMWIEDVIVPDGNDYLYFLGNFFTNPEQEFLETDGYSVALYGHYLSHIIEKVEDKDETLNTIIRKVWEKFGETTLNPIEAFNYVLSDVSEEDWEVTTFIETWVDFCSRNLHNGQFSSDIADNDIYYYIDQTSDVLDKLDIENGYNLNTNEPPDILSSIVGKNIEFSLDDRSIEIHSIEIDSVASVNMTYSNLPYYGKYIITENESPSLDNAKIADISSDDILLGTNNIIHFIYAGSGNISVTSNASYFPTTPEIKSVFNIEEGSIQLSWHPSMGDGELEYKIYRDEVLIVEQLSETYYIDTDILANTEYVYKVSCLNHVGESDKSESISITSWPADSEIVTSEIISLYPNPIYRPGLSKFNLIVDYGQDMYNVDVKIYDITGQEIVSKNLGPRNQGRTEEFFGSFLSTNLSSGIYFIYIICDNEEPKGLSPKKEKFTILK